MVRLIRFVVAFAIFFAAGASGAFASTHYISTSGSDSNDGLSQSTPWAHAPGMNGCTGNCAGYSPTAGDQFILRGGDTWHTSVGSPIGLPWTWQWSGNASNRIYIGVDQSWFSGSSFTRPVFTMDNPVTTASPSSCTYDDSSKNGLTISGSYVTIDNFEFTGKCWASDPTGHYTVGFSGNYNKATNVYIHGWSVASSAADDNHVMFSAGGQNSEWSYAVVDGFDSTFGAACTSPSCVNSGGGSKATGWAFGGSNCYNINHSVIRHISNGIQCSNINIVHDNLFEYSWNPSFGGRHGNTLESDGGNNVTTFYFYNNMAHNLGNAVQFWAQFSTGYIFNNIMGDTYNGGFSPPDPNCLMLSPPGFSSGSGIITVYLYNNTFPATCSVQAFGGNANTPTWASGSSITWQNNHIIGKTAISGGLFRCQSPSTCQVVDNGGEVFQTSANASSQGYTNSNGYAPTSGNDATVNAGVSAASFCGTASPDDNALCSGTTAGVIESPGNGGFVAVSSAVSPSARPATGAWDSGAYLYGGSTPTATRPNPPSGLAATVQ